MALILFRAGANARAIGAARAFSGYCGDGEVARHRAGLVSPRPAHRRPCGAVPRAQGGAPGLVRLRLRPRHPRSAAARRPAGRVHPAERRCARRRPGRARPSATAAAASACSSATGQAQRRDRRPGRASCTCRRSTPTTTTTRTPWRATPHVRGALADRGVALHTSKDHVVFERGEVLTGSGKPYSVFTPYQHRLAEEARRLLPQAPTRSSAMRRASPPRRPASTRRLPIAGARSASSRPTWRASRSTAAAPPPRRCSTTSSAASTTTTTARDYPGGQGPELPRRAPALRHDLDPPAGAARRTRRGAASDGAADLALRADLARLLPADPAPPAARRRRTAASPSTTGSASSTAATPTSASPPGARAAPAIRWSTRRWRRSTRPAGCTTGCAW